MRLWRAAVGFAREDYERLRRAAAEAARCCAIGADEGARQHLDTLAQRARRHVRVVENLVAAGPLPARLQRDHERLLALVEQARAALAARDHDGFCRTAAELGRLVDRHEAAERGLFDVARGFQHPADE